MASRILLIIFTVTFLSACETSSYISLEVQRPAEVSFSAPISKIVVVDNSVAQPKDYGHLVYAFQKKQDNLSFDADVYRRLFIDNLVRKLKLENKISVLSDRVYSSKSFSDVKSIEMAEVNEIANKTNADLVLSVDNNLLASQFRLTYLPDENLYRLTFDAMQSVVLSVFERVDSSFRSQKLIHKDSLYWESFDFSSEAAMVRFPDRKICMEDLINHSIDRLAKKLFSNKEIVQRPLYATANSNMLDAARYAKKNKWAEAAYIWEFMYENSKNQRLKGFCAANLALYSEIIDQFDQAIYWVNVAKSSFQNDAKSRNIGDDRIMDSYAKELKQRKVEVVILQKQNVN